MQNIQNTRCALKIPSILSDLNIPSSLTHPDSLR
jgi:hypothetical protein